MMKKTKTALLVLGFIGTAVLGPTTVNAAPDPIKAACDVNPDSQICKQGATGGSADTLIQNIIKTLFFALGVICVIVIIIAGIQYAVAGGDSAQITKAKNSILYAIVGLVIAMLAYAIVGFVTQQFAPPPKKEGARIINLEMGIV